MFVSQRFQGEDRDDSEPRNKRTYREDTRDRLRRMIDDEGWFPERFSKRAFSEDDDLDDDLDGDFDDIDDDDDFDLDDEEFDLDEDDFDDDADDDDWDDS